MFLFDFRRTGGRALSDPWKQIRTRGEYYCRIRVLYNIYIGTYILYARLYIYNKRHGERYRRSGMRGAGLVRSQPPHRGDTRSTVINISRTPHVNQGVRAHRQAYARLYILLLLLLLFFLYTCIIYCYTDTQIYIYIYISFHRSRPITGETAFLPQSLMDRRKRRFCSC